MIIKVCEDTPKIGLRIVQPGCNGKQLMDTGVVLAITPISCPRPERLVPYWENCELKYRDETPRIPSLEYPAFDISDDGLVIFYLDRKAWALPPGRYKGYIIIGGHCSNTTFDIDLCNTSYVIDQAVVIPNPCGDLNQC